MSNLATGNAIGPLDSASRNSLSIPGFSFCKATGYIALKPTPGNRFTLVEPTGKQDGIDRLLSIPKGAFIYTLGLRTGEGFFNKTFGHSLHLTLMDQGIVQPLITQDTGPMRNSDAQNFGPGFPLDPQRHPSGRLENKVLSGWPSNDCDTLTFSRDPFAPIAPAETFAAINQYLAETSGVGTTPAYAKAHPGYNFEIQVRIGPNPNDILADLLTGGILQNPKPAYKDKGYAIVDIGYVMRDWAVSSSENINVHWEDVFKYVF